MLTLDSGEHPDLIKGPLRDLGYVDGKNLTFIHRSAECSAVDRANSAFDGRHGGRGRADIERGNDDIIPLICPTPQIDFEKSAAVPSR
ncbi:hypothetical protein [Bradyrhizobium guangxiense]|uniref:hypothetical protein n=1 Tax=Bradyrhizobium guangxiense TaxID=1325115 RepID=UPI00100904A7|nr:hypothetical protein [Bradyrhizobium guangxiense]